jgi:hypothetical protein
MKFKSIAMTGMLSLAGLGLVGAGAHAVFTTTTSSAQTINAGTLGLTLSANNATGTGAVGNPLVLPAVANVGSSFVSAPELITITNTGSLAASEINLQVTDSATLANNNVTNSALAGGMYACFYSDGAIVFNGLLSSVEGLGNMAVGGSVPIGRTDTYTVVFYAGSVDTGCGNVGLAAGASSYIYPPVNYPVQTVAGTDDLSTDAVSLGNTAEGGSDTVSVTMTYSA